MRNSFIVLGAAVVLGTAACARLPALPDPAALIGGPATIHVAVAAKAGAMPVQRQGRPLSVAVAAFADGRAARPGRKVGDIRATVRGMHGNEILLDEDVTSLIDNVVRSRLAADGFRVVPAGTAADFVLAGTVRTFSLNVAGRDERHISLEATLRDAVSGDTVWAGTIADQEDRYAGVNGNSRETIAEYLGEGVAEVADKLSGVVRTHLIRAYPQSVEAAPQRVVETIAGVTTQHAAVARELPVAAPAPAGVVGNLWIQSAPTRAKVYVEDVYFGLSPLKVELPVGVRQVRLKLDGYQTVTEKVSVRRGETTEMEVRLEK
jgi:hypothetical protein